MLTEMLAQVTYLLPNAFSREDSTLVVKVE